MGENIISVNVANFVTITIMAMVGLALASMVNKGMKGRMTAAMGG